MPEKTIYHRMKALNARMAANYKRGFGPTRIVLLLTTTGRKSGQPRCTFLTFDPTGQPTPKPLHTDLAWVWAALLPFALFFSAWLVFQGAAKGVGLEAGYLFGFTLSALFLGLAYGFIAYRTGSAKWTAVSHSLSGILALSGYLVPSLLARFFR
jgi:hypothetical protein